MHDKCLEPYLTSIYTCIKCRACMTSSTGCHAVCPMTERHGFLSYSSSGMIAAARSLWEGALEWDRDLAQLLFQCTMCRACAQNCRNYAYLTNRHFDVPRLVEKMREELVSLGMVPRPAASAFTNIHRHGNAFGLPAVDRAKWAEGLAIGEFSGQEFLFYVGDAGSYDERGQRSARAVARCLERAGVSFGILGARERSDGNDVKAMGEGGQDGLLQLLAEANIREWKEIGVRKIVTLSPHAYNAFRNVYPVFGGQFEVAHYTQILADRVETGRLVPAELRVRVTYHDPCYLGRHNGEVEAPRRLLRSVPGLELAEMALHGEDAFCCGGGGGNFWTDMLGSVKDSPHRIRARQAAETGAGILAVACPMCAKMLDDGVKAEGLDGAIQVRDVGELVGA